MKTTYKADRGHVIHVVHETKTGAAWKMCWTLCGEYFHSGVRGNKAPTCPGCLRYDNPLNLSHRSRTHFTWIVAPDLAPGFSGGRGALEELVRSDFLNHEGSLTRRGAAIAEDFTAGVVPLADAGGLMHTRYPLVKEPRCSNSIVLPDALKMTTRQYELLRKVESDFLVTCLQCLSDGPS